MVYEARDMNSGGAMVMMFEPGGNWLVLYFVATSRLA